MLLRAAKLVENILFYIMAALLGLLTALIIVLVILRYFFGTVIIGMSNIYIWILGVERVPEAVIGVVTVLNLSPIALMFAIAVILLIIGTFMEVTPSILLLALVLLPVVISVGIEPIQLGVLMVCGLGIGAVTPPVGMCINVCTALTNLGMGEIFKYALPFLFANLLTLILVIFLPAVSLWVPSLFNF